jgi:hypothetical protein
MGDWTSTSQFEENIRQSFGVPAMRSEFVDQVYADLMRLADVKSRKSRPFLRLQPVWIVALIILSMMIIGVLLIGPQRVYAEFMKLFGYIPGVGIVDQSGPIRVLAGPVSVTRDGISVTVTSATLTADKTHIEYRIFGVPGSAYPAREDVVGCILQPYLHLPDGTHLIQNDDFSPIPAGVNEAVFMMPCIQNTLPGKAPENWELPLRFVPASPELTVMPVIEISPSPASSLLPNATALPENDNSTPASVLGSSLTINRVVETSEGYILIGQFQPQNQPDEWIQTGPMEIWDTSGKKVAYTYPQDISPETTGAGSGGMGWAVQFNAAGLVYPLTITIPGARLLRDDSSATAEFIFDAGTNPQPGQEWILNREIQLAGHTLRLNSISADSRNGYAFYFQGGSSVYSTNVQIADHTPNGWGSGGIGDMTGGVFSVSLSFAQIPAGKLKVILSDLVLFGDAFSEMGQWSPATPRTDLPANPTRQPGVCLTADSITRLEPISPVPPSGKALVYEKLDESNNWGLVVYNLDGSQKQVVTSSGNWGALSPDGNQVAFSALDNHIHIVDLASQEEKVLAGASGFDLHWSSDGKHIAYIGMVGSVIDSVFIVNMEDGTPARQISDWSYETVIGWSPDNSRLYFAVPFTGGAAWKVFSFDLASDLTKELFTIENGTPKFLNASLSPDGNWITYRGKDNSSLYMVRIDSSDMHRILDNVGAGRVEWSRSGWLGVTLLDFYTNESSIVVIKPDDCEAYRLPVLHGELEGLFIP